MLKLLYQLSLLLLVVFMTIPAVADPPGRVVSLGPIITETIYLLGADDRLVADTAYCKVPADAMNKIKIGSVMQVDVEKIVALKPDIVLASALARGSQLQLMKHMGLNVVQFHNPETFADMCRMTREIGRLMGKADAADRIIRDSRKAVDEVIAKTAGLPRKKVFMQVGLKPLHTSPKGTFTSEFIEFAGGINIAANARTGNYSREKVLQENPDIILIATMGTSKSGARKEKAIWMGYKSLKAAQTNRIYILDPEVVCSPTPVGFIEALQEIALLIHPDYQNPIAP
ncbi:MAG: helical backbone metal receptor [Thermodesulfobacteriota bacterium]|nr:helical backbone metal receptor [Thermodesulfobacteriota bacterium]